MPSLLEQVAAGLARLHAISVTRRFHRELKAIGAAQEAALQRALRVVLGSGFSRQFGLDRVRSRADLRTALPLQTYEDLRPVMDRLWEGDTGALFGPSQRICLFATSSGTTAAPKRIPVTPAFVREYRRGWNIFGLKLLLDHPEAILRPILQVSGRSDAQFSPAGVPCGAITGLLARTQKRIVRRFYVGGPAISQISDARARYYMLMRLGILRDVAWAVTASPGTLIQMARVADEESERLIRDIHDGTLSSELLPDASLRRDLVGGLRPAPQRARELAAIRQKAGTLRPRDYWRLSFLACWIGGSMSQYLERLRHWYGDIPVRDIGLLASEGRVTIPLEDLQPLGVLDVQSAAFEFIPDSDLSALEPRTLLPEELEVGREYAVVLTNATGLCRYRLDDIVCVRGWREGAPLLEFIRRGGGTVSIAGEKLTETQVAAAMRTARAAAGHPEIDYILFPVWTDPPHYQLCCEIALPELAAQMDRALEEVNEEYESRRRSGRLGPLVLAVVPEGSFSQLDTAFIQKRQCAREQYKRPLLLADAQHFSEILSATRQHT